MLNQQSDVGFFANLKPYLKRKNFNIGISIFLFVMIASSKDVLEQAKHDGDYDEKANGYALWFLICMAGYIYANCFLRPDKNNHGPRLAQRDRGNHGAIIDIEPQPDDRIELLPTRQAPPIPPRTDLRSFSRTAHGAQITFGSESSSAIRIFKSRVNGITCNFGEIRDGQVYIDGQLINPQLAIVPSTEISSARNPLDLFANYHHSTTEAEKLAIKSELLLQTSDAASINSHALLVLTLIYIKDNTIDLAKEKLRLFCQYVDITHVAEIINKFLESAEKNDVINGTQRDSYFSTLETMIKSLFQPSSSINMSY